MVASRKLEGAKASGSTALTAGLALSAAGVNPWVTLGISFISALPGLLQVASQTYLDSKLSAKLQGLSSGAKELDGFRGEVDDVAGKIVDYKPKES